MEINMNPLQKQMLDDVFDAFTMLSNGGFVSLMHVDGGFTRYSAGAVELFGLPGEYIPNGAMGWSDYLHPEDRKRYMDIMMPLLSGGTQTYDLTYRVRTVKGEYVNFRAVGAVLRGSDGKPSLIGGAMINQGLTENTDPVTVLPNKNAYQEKLSQLLEEGESVVSLMIGIDRFSRINEMHSYTYGNRTLQEVAWSIQEVVKDRGTVFRGEGASFLVLSDTLTRDEAAAIYDHIRYQLQRGIQVNGIKNILTAGGGMISSVGTEVSASTVYACMNYAYEESRRHKHGDLVDFNGSVNYAGTGTLALINTIRECVADGCRGFALEYLPVIDAQTERVNGAEAVICWQDEHYGKVEPEAFMPILERDFIFEELGDFILEQGLRDGVKLLTHDPGFLLCLNVYRIQLESSYFIDTLLHYLRATGFPPQQLSLKFNNGCRFIGMERLKTVINALHEHGILTIIEDFGSGSDSIGFLRSVPVDAVGINSPLSRDIEADTRARSTLDYLTRMAAEYVAHINVKGISTRQMRDIVRAFSVTTLQGSYFSDPLSLEAFVEKYYKGNM